VKKFIHASIVFILLFVFTDVSYGTSFDNFPKNTWVYDTTQHKVPEDPQNKAPYDFSGWITLGYDPVREKAILFGLACSQTNQPTDGGYANDVWIFDLNTSQWALIHPTDPYNWGSGPFNPAYPEPRHFFGGVAYDTRRGKIVLYGGAHRTRSYNDTWTFNFVGNIFEKKIEPQPYWIDPSLCNSLTPPYMQGHTISYDSDADLFVVASGGTTGACGLGDPKTWVYSPVGNTWTKIIPSGQPSDYRGGSAYVYDPIRKRILRFGAANSDTSPASNWLLAYNSTANAWTNLNPSNPPSGRGHASFAYDARNDIFLLFGGEAIEGNGYLNDTWIYYPKENRFAQVFPTLSPPANNLTRGHLMQYDPKRGVFILYTLQGMWYYKVDDVALPDYLPPVRPDSKTFKISLLNR
jgi:hypothetical protein